MRCLALILALFVAAPAFADIAAYNAAVRRADFKAAAVEAKTTWPTLDRTRPDLALIAREFGWSAMIGEAPDTARDIMLSLAEANNDTQPEVSAALLAWANFRIKPAADTRDALFSALTTRSATRREDLISLKAAQELHQYDWDRDQLDKARADAALTVKFAAELGPDYADVWYAARRNEMLADFVERASRGDYIKIRALEDEIFEALLAQTNTRRRNELVSQYYQTMSWRFVQLNVLKQVTSSSIPEEPRSEQRKRELQLYELLFTTEKSSLPFCNVDIDDRGMKLKYPRPAQAKRLPGFAVYAFELGEGGQLKSGRVLGSAPHSMFTETIDEILPNWGWKFGPGPQPPDCRMPNPYVLRFYFAFR